MLRHWLVLLMRMIALALLILAFARPYIPYSGIIDQKREGHAVSIYLDNSFSMDGRSATGSLFDVGLNKAREIAGSYGTADEFQIITNDFEGKHQRLVSRDELFDFLQEVSVSPSVRNISEVVKRQNDLLADNPEYTRSVFLISDFQQSTADIENIGTDSAINTYFVPVKSYSQSNLYIDSCWFVSPVHQLGQRVTLVARIRNTSDTDYEKIPVKLMMNGQQRALASFDIRSWQSVDVELPFTIGETGYHYASVEITDYPIIYDDIFYLSFMVEEKLSVLSINRESDNQFLNALFGNDEAFSFKSMPVNNINYEAFRNHSLIILNEVINVSTGLADELKHFMEAGGTLLIIPGDDIDIPAYRNFLQGLKVDFYIQKVEDEARVDYVEFNHPIYKDVFETNKRDDGSNIDLPKVKSYFEISRGSATGMLTLMRLQNRLPFLSMKEYGKGNIYLLAVPLEDSYSNLQRHAMFVPTLFNIGLLSAATVPLYYTIGSNEIIEYPGDRPAGDDVFRISAQESEFEFIPEIRLLNKRINLLVHNQIKEAGHYELRENGDALQGLSFNFDRRESVLDYLSSGEIREQASNAGIHRYNILEDNDKPMGDIIEEIKSGRQLWRLFIILALAFIALEIVLLRFWK